MEIVEETMGANQNFPVIKGRRTKRPRPSSPCSRASTSSVGGNSGGEGEGGAIHGNEESSSMGAIEFLKNTEEEKDMANCLILLARGCNKHQEQRRDRGSGDVEAREGLHSYQCKTCNRSFSSFQALGTHRVSHRKPKAMIDEESKALAQGQFDSNNTHSDQPLVVLPADHHHIIRGSNKSKVHECSICGSEFSSGQALGGHMRRHRYTTIPVAIKKENLKDQKSENVFGFDLNLPAPEEDVFTSKQALIFSAPALVDCYY